MEGNGADVPTQGDIRLDCISMNEWRVRDKRYHDTDSRAVLGFIERRDEYYEVTNIQRPSTVTRYGSLSTATGSFAVIQEPARN
jgi:hypothetical protein